MKYEFFKVDSGKTIAAFDSIPDAVEFARDWVKDSNNTSDVAVKDENNNIIAFWKDGLSEYINVQFLNDIE